MLSSLLRVRVLSARNGLTRTTGSDRRRAWMAPVWILVMAVLVEWSAAQILDPLFQQAGDSGRVALVARHLPGFMLFGAFWMLALSGVTVAIQALYMSEEMGLLLVAPIRPRTAFVAKIVDATLLNSVLFAMLGAPIVVAYAQARGMLSVEYVLRSGFTLAAFCVLPTTLGMVAAIGLMRVLPANRMREIIAAIGVTLLAVAYLGISYAARRYGDSGHALDRADGVLALLTSPISTAGPWGWAGAILSTPTGYPDTYAVLLLLLAPTVAAVGLGALLWEQLHWRGWTAAQEAVPARVTGGMTRLDWERRLALLPGPVRAYLLKDLRCLARDMRQLSLLLMPVAVLGVFLYNIASSSDTQPAPAGLLSLALLPIVGMVSMRIATSAFVGESQALWSGLSSPATARGILAGKLAYTLVLSLPLTALALLAFGRLRGMSTGETWAFLGVSMVAGTAMAALGVGLGATGFDQRMVGARHPVTGAARILIFGLQLVYSLVIAAVLVPAWLLTRYSDWPAVPVWTAAVLLVLSVSGACIWAPIAWGSRRLEALEL